MDKLPQQSNEVPNQRLQSKANAIIVNLTSPWLTVETQQNRKVILDVFKSLHNIGATHQHNKYQLIDHNIGTRERQSIIKLPRVNSEAGRKSSTFTGAKLFNSLPLTIRNEKSFVKFKRLVNDVNHAKFVTAIHNRHQYDAM